MRKWIGLIACVVSAATLGCAQKTPEQTPTAQEKTYKITPESVTVKAGIVNGEISDMKVTESVEQGSGNVVSPPQLHATLKLKNSAKDQAVRLVSGKLLYLDANGKSIEVEKSRSEPTISFGTSDRLDPEQETSQPLEVDFPATALNDTKVKTINLQLTYLPTPYREETASFGVSVSAE